VFPLADPHRPAAETDRHEGIVLLALGETVAAEFAAHVATCQRCQRDLDACSHVIELARESAQHRSIPTIPPPRVWSRIIEDLETTAGFSDPSGPQALRVRPAPPRRTWSRRALAIAAGVVIAIGVAVGGFAVGRSTSHPSSPAAAQATLLPQPGGPPAAAGAATIKPSADGSTLAVTTAGLPARNGYYEVWLYNPTINHMVAVGTLGDDARGTFTIPAGLDLAAYHVVDVSAQNYDGNPAHQQSVLRGQLHQ
jgi:hypothetical protein